MTKNGRPWQTRFFRRHGCLVHVLVGEELILHCHETGDCCAAVLRASFELSQSADCQSLRSRVWYELLQSAGGCQSERSRVFFRTTLVCLQIFRQIPGWSSDNMDWWRQNHSPARSKLLVCCAELGCFLQLQQIISRTKNLDTFPQILVHSPKAKVKCNLIFKTCDNTRQSRRMIQLVLQKSDDAGKINRVQSDRRARSSPK